MRLVKSTSATSHCPESVFGAKYQWLFQWAMHFSQNDRARAEDLVQDAFVQFVLSQSEIQDPGKRGTTSLYLPEVCSFGAGSYRRTLPLSKYVNG